MALILSFLSAIFPSRAWRFLATFLSCSSLLRFLRSWLVFAFFSTRLYTTLTAFDLAQLMACPVSQGVGWRAQHCRVDEQAGGLYRVFPLEHWRVGRALLALPLVGRALAAARGTFACSEMQLHAVAFAVFASLVAPFGGFFASGFKRAFRIKDFGAAIPGHGGFTDRM